MTGRAGSLLPWIVAFKAAKTALLTALGFTLLFALRRDPVELVIQLAEAVHLPLSSRLFDRALGLALRVSPRTELGAAIAAFGYALLLGAEGVGLYLRRQWARWFTIGATSSLIPIELYEILRHPRVLRIAILVFNVAVVVYLARRKEIFTDSGA